jgi:hypothetical protein
MRPRRASGVTTCRSVWRTTVESRSARPVPASARKVRMKFRERPKVMVAAP